MDSLFSKLLVVTVEPSVTGAFAVAGWIKYLQEEKGALVGGGGAADSEDEEVGATPAASDDD